MATVPFVLTPATYPRPLSVVGLDITVLASAATTGSYEVTMQVGNAGSGPPLHSHPWDECFFVVKGEVDFSFTDRAVKAVAGTLFHVPAGTPHGFRIVEDGTTMMEFTGQGSRSTQMFANLDREAPRGPPTPADVPNLIAILGRNGVTVET